MKKLLLGLVAVFATTAFSADMYFDVDAGYAMTRQNEENSHGFNVAPGFYYNVMTMHNHFIDSLAVGATVDYTMFRKDEINTHTIFVGAMGQLNMNWGPLDGMFELGLGYAMSKVKDSDANHDMALKTGLGCYYPLAHNMKLGLVADFNFNFGLKEDTDTSWSINVGPSFAMSL